MAAPVAARLSSGFRVVARLPQGTLLRARVSLQPLAPAVLASQGHAALSTPTRRLLSTSAVASSPAEVAERTSPSPAPQGGPENNSWQVKILYDGDCPICMREVDFLQKRNEQYGALKFVDISDPEYSADANAGISFEEAMGHIHGITRDGEVIKGVEAFRKFYEAVGLGWVYAVTKLPPVLAVADAVYDVWAKYRLPLSGRPSLDAVLEERRRAKVGLKSCDDPEEECEVDY